MGLKSRIASWIVGKAAGEWQKYFLRGASEGDFSDELCRPFEKSVWVMRAIKHVAEPISSVPLKWSLADEPFDDEALEQFFAAPVIGVDSYDEFVEAWIGWLKLKGESFLILDDTWSLPHPALAAKGGKLSQLILAPPSAMQEIALGNRLVAWAYRDDDGKTVTLSPEQVIQVKSWNPYNRWRGLAEYEAAHIAATTDYLAGKYEAGLMRNNGDQGMVVTTDGGQPSREQIEQIEASLKRKRQRLQRGEFTDIFLAGGLKVQSPQPQAADANFVAGRLQKRHEIFIAFGVPPSLGDVKQSYSLGKDSDYRALIVNTCMPAAGKMARALTKIGVKLTGKPVEAYTDFDEHPVLQEVRNERTETLGRLCDRGMPVHDASDYLGMDLPRFAGDDVGWMPFSVQPVNTPAPQSDATFDETNDSSDAVQEMLRALRAGVRSQESEVRSCECACDLSDATLKSANPQWAANMAARRVTIKQFQSRISRVLMDARRETLSKLEALAAPTAKQRVGAAADFVFDLAKFKDAFFAGMRAVGAQAVQDAGDKVWESLGKDDPWKVAPEKVLDFVARRKNKLKDVPQDVWEQIRDAVQQGFDNGDSTSKIAAAIRSEFNGIDRERAKTIAITETGAAYGFGEHESQKDAGITKRQWITSGNPNVRVTHQAAEGQIRGIDEPFNVGGASLMYPGDESGPPEEVINCHCVAIALSGDKE